jgi:hypothetical protein
VSRELDFNEYKEETTLFCSCNACHAEIAQESVYCRWCGIEQPEPQTILKPSDSLRNYQVTIRKSSPFVTTPFDEEIHDFTEVEKSDEENFRVSGYLIRSFVESVKSTSSQFQGGFEKIALALLTFIPVCLLIIFLSPLDAYFAAKNFLKG